MQDHYEILQVHPKADSEALRDAYARLRERYDPARLEGAAEELQQLARQRRDAIEQAFTVLSDPQLRRRYDAERAEDHASDQPAGATSERVGDDDDDAELDYRPLPPARRQERPADFNSQPVRQVVPRGRGRSSQHSQQPLWLAPALIVAASTFAIVLVTLLNTVMNTPQPVATSGPQVLAPNAAAPTSNVVQVVNQFEGQIVAARQVANAVPENPNAWIELGNALYDSVIVVRERLDQGDLTVQSIYVERIPRWLEAADAYRRAAELDPGSALANADLAASLCYYGQSINDPSYISAGTIAAEHALRLDANEGRALLGAGICYAFASPPRTAEALEQWQRLVILPDIEPGLIFQARQLIQTYSSP